MSNPINIKNVSNLNNEKSNSYPINTYKSSYETPKNSFGERRNSRSISFDYKNESVKGAGILPYCKINNKIHFLFQRTIYPESKKKIGFTDFGGRKEIDDKDSLNTASREFNEETSTLFYLKNRNTELYNELKDNPLLKYSDETIQKLKNIIPEAQEYFVNNYNFDNKIQLKDTYICYLIKVDYIDVADIPRSEDIFINYQDKYIRECKWMSVDEIQNIDYSFFHKRLQIIHFKEKIQEFLNNLIIN